jgi:hypothetical protein
MWFYFVVGDLGIDGCVCWGGEGGGVKGIHNSIEVIPGFLEW